MTKYPRFEITEGEEEGETVVSFETDDIYIFVVFKKDKIEEWKSSQ